MSSLGIACLAVVAFLVGTGAACSAPNPEFDRTFRDGDPADRPALDAGDTDRAGPADSDTAGPADSDTAGPADSPSLDLHADVTPPAALDLLTGLIGYWRMDEPADSRVARDSSGLRNDGMLELLPADCWVDGRFGSALDITDNDKNYGVRVTPSKRITDLTRYTLAAWVKRLRLRPVAYQSIISRQLGADIAEVFDMSVSLDRLQAYAPDRTSGSVTAISVPRTAPVNVWFHAAATYDGRTITIYQDGVAENSVAWTKGLPASTAPLYIGTNKNESGPSDSHHPWEGELDEVLLYDVALPLEAIQALAGGMRPPVPDP